MYYNNVNDIFKKEQEKQKKIKEQDLINRLNDEQRYNDLKALLNISAGRRIIWEIMINDCFLFKNIYKPGGNETTITAWNEGRRSLAIKLLEEIIKIDKNFVFKMLNEYESKQINLLKNVRSEKDGN